MPCFLCRPVPKKAGANRYLLCAVPTRNAIEFCRTFAHSKKILNLHAIKGVSFFNCTKFNCTEFNSCLILISSIERNIEACILLKDVLLFTFTVPPDKLESDIFCYLSFFLFLNVKLDLFLCSS